MTGFPILAAPSDCPKSVPWYMVEDHARQVQYNHDQSVQRLAERGGLNPIELYLVLHDRPLSDHRRVSMERAVEYLKTLHWVPCSERGFEHE
jgi:hypothetical protein